MEIFKFVTLVIVAYFVGNISWARLLSSTKKSDITKSGSGNPGTMNMLRTYGAKLALVTLVLDILKGAIPTLLAYLAFGGATNLPFAKIALYSAGLAVIVGHCFPICYNFKGGKGVACALGVFLVSQPLWLMVFFVIAFVYVWIFSYGSVGSLIIVTALTVIEGLSPVNRGNIILSLLLFFIFILIVWLHRKNIQRLFTGKENKVNLSKAFKKQHKTEMKEIKQITKQTKKEERQQEKLRKELRNQK